MPERPYHWAGQPVAGILERMEYTGCTCNFKTYSKSYKLHCRRADQERYRKMSADYEAEQERLKLEIEVTEEWVEQQPANKKSRVNYGILKVLYRSKTRYQNKTARNVGLKKDIK